MLICLPALQAHIALLSRDPEGVRAVPPEGGRDALGCSHRFASDGSKCQRSCCEDGRNEAGESHYRGGRGGVERRYFQGAVKVVHILHLRGNADALDQVRVSFIVIGESILNIAHMK